MFSCIRSATVNGVIGRVIDVEVHTSSGFPGYTVVGMPDAAMRESKERIRSALKSSKVEWPKSRITINLAPANMRKSGTATELAILIGLLCCSKIINPDIFKNAGVIGELGLDGSAREITGTIARVLALRDKGIVNIYLPYKNAYEASLVPGVNIYAIENVCSLISCTNGEEEWPEIKPPDLCESKIDYGDYSEILNQPVGCEAMMVLAAGGHHTLLMGTPGIGKTMLAERVPSIACELSQNASYEVSAIQSIVEGNVVDLTRTRPFRQPHHGASTTALIGGGSKTISLGEVTRAHRGFLFLDELAEFPRRTLDFLRQPLESGVVTIARAEFSAVLPAKFTLIACSNPCPCAKPRDKCICDDFTRSNYIKKLSGPLLDRFDIRLELTKPLGKGQPTHNSKEMREKVFRAYEIQKKRFRETSLENNSQMKSKDIKEIAPLKNDVEELLVTTCETREISYRGSIAISRVARTIADLEASNDVTQTHLLKALDMREEIA